MAVSPNHPCRTVWILLLIMGTYGPLCAAEPVDFIKDVQPIFAAHCLKCHGVDKQEGGLRLDHRATALRGGDSGPLLTPHKSSESEIYTRIASDDESLRMPPPDPENKPLSAEQIAVLRRWIDQGAVWPDDGARLRVQSDHWAYQPLADPELPRIENAGWVHNDIDAFVLARLEADNLAPSPEADRYTLIKRLHYDLIGLPPTPAEVDEFIRDTRPDAYEMLVERLLRSPHFGERWGRHWLDKARYADSDGYEKDRPRPDAWRYRDWVIDAVNADLPFDQFTIEQLAGDLLPNPTAEQILATAFHRQTLTNTEGGTDKEQFRVEAVVDRVNTAGTVWLGLTVGCAQCHSHKYDQISQADYYELFAFFNNGDETTAEVPISPEALEDYQVRKAAHDKLVAELQAKIAADKRQFAESLTEPLPAVAESGHGRKPPTALDHTFAQSSRGRTLTAQLAQLQKRAPKSPYMEVRVISQRTRNPRTTHILRRGDFLQPQDPVEPDGLAVLPPVKARVENSPPDRLDLGRWLTSGENPLPPRVLVNHVWRQLFGQGLVTTANDFGVRGEPPTHPQLLDFLARQYRDEFGWSRKRLIQFVVCSATYRQESRIRDNLADLDPQNKLLHRQNRVRVEAEIVRDLYLAASGLLSRKVGGPSVFPPMPADVAALSYANNFKWQTSKGGDRYRRGMYTFFKRTAPHPSLVVFDCPDANTTAVERRTSNTPLMALTTLNDQVFVEAAQALAERVLTERPGADDTDRLTYALRLCIARPPRSDELEACAELLQKARAYYTGHPQDAEQLTSLHRASGISAAESAAWTVVARTILNADEFITRE